MNKNYVSPSVEIKNFLTEDVIAASGVNNPLTAHTSKTFSLSDANVSWNNKTLK